MRRRRAIVSLALAATLAGCASTSPDASFKDMASQVERQSGHRVMWDQGGDDDAKLRKAVRDLLASEMSVDAAVQVALLRNPGLRATYEDLSIAQADVVQAGLLKNPVFTAHVPPEDIDSLASPPIVFGVTQEFVDLLMIPARKKVAKAQLDEARLRVVGEVLELASKTRAAYFTLQGALQTVAMRRSIAQAAETALDFATRQMAAGNLSEFDHANERASYDQIRLDLAESELAATTSRAALAKLLGVWGPEMEFRVPAALPAVPAEEVLLEHLESVAIGQRAELAAARQRREVLARATSLARSTRWIGTVEIGADVTRLKSGNVAVGPSASIELPIFDQRQAVIARLESASRAAAATEQAIAIDVRADVYAARARMLAARGAAEHYRTVILPTRQNVTRLAQQRYDAMLLGVYQLLQIRQRELDAMREYLDAVRDYWIARSDLERAVGGRLPGAPMPHGG